MRLGTLAKGLALAGLLLGGTALTAPAMAQDKTISGGFDVGPGGFPNNFNPLVATGGFMWLKTYYEPLVIYNAELSALEGALASDWTIGEDQLTYTFTLVEETWHDGEAFDAEDVKFTLDLARNAESGSVFAARLSAIEAVEVTDERTVTLTLNQPNGSLLSVLAQVMILPEHALGDEDVANIANSNWWSTEAIGTGPFAFSRYVTDQYVEVIADEDYRLGRPKVDRLINRYFENPAAAVSALRAGEIQFTYVESDDATTFADDANFEVIEGNSFVVNYIGFNQMVDIWEDVRVRQAVMHAIDRNAIIESLYGGAAQAAQCGYVAPHLVPDGLNEYAYDPELARQLLAEAGWDQINGNAPITWLTYYDSPQAANVMAAIQAMLSQVGINVVPRVVDVPTYNGIVYQQENPAWTDFALVYAGLQNGPDPAGINPGLNGSQLPPVGANIMRIEFDDLSAAFDAALGETDPAQSDARWQEVCRVMNEQLPWGTMWVANRYGVASTDLVDFVWTPAPAGGPYADHPELWDIQ
ncbi:ABC transporter substrate-binding protein [Pelagibacterium mangrovi]|uniref:ABC transporter substrate-binding protein n=1 Tax=Pelagibacterium mangrovi TaxID=3119828 RepID=UPI003F822F2D